MWVVEVDVDVDVDVDVLVVERVVVVFTAVEVVEMVVVVGELVEDVFVEDAGGMVVPVDCVCGRKLWKYSWSEKFLVQHTERATNTQQRKINRDMVQL